MPRGAVRPHRGAAGDGPLSDPTPQQAAERVARESYGRLLALLVSRTRDVAAAEDALADAFAAALSAWPRAGAPDNPAAWLFAAARRKLIDTSRRARTAAEAQTGLRLALEELTEMQEGGAIPDRRLALLFACAHPDVEPGARTPLMLQTVLGFSAERIAAAFLVDAAAMSQRLVRAKRRIKETGAAFELPAPEQWPERVGAVLEAIYAAYAAGWSDPLGADPSRRALDEEAIWLGRVLAAHLPDEAEALGLLSLMLHLDARKAARRDADGRFVPLDEQDVSRWRRDRIDEAERLLRSASRYRRAGRFQLEAAIQSAHAARLWRSEPDWAAIALLYDALAHRSGSPIALLNAAAALARRDGPQAGFVRLEALIAEHPMLARYQPYWALRADLCAKLGRTVDARAAYAEAIERESDPVVQDYLRGRCASLQPG